MPPHPLTNFEIQKYYQNKPIICNFSRNNIPKIRDGAYIINLDYKNMGINQLELIRELLNE